MPGDLDRLGPISEVFLSGTICTFSRVDLSGSDCEVGDAEVFLDRRVDRSGRAPIVRYAPDLHFDDLHLLVAQLGEFHPTATIGDLELFLKRLKSFPALGID